MKKSPPNHSHKFSIADKDAVDVLFRKFGKPTGSRCVDDQKFLQALNCAARQYANTDRNTKRAFFHGLLTGYSVGMKHL